MRYAYIIIILIFTTIAPEASPLGGEPPRSGEPPRTGTGARGSESANTPDTPQPASSPILPSGLRSRSALQIGHWVKYNIKRYDRDLTQKTEKENQGKDELLTLSETEIKIAIIGKHMLYEQEYFWTEMVINEGKEQQRVVRFLLDKQGTPQPEKIIVKHGLLPAVEINLRAWEVKTRVTREAMFQEMIGRFNFIPFTRLAELEAERERSPGRSVGAGHGTPATDKDERQPVGEEDIAVELASHPETKQLLCTKVQVNQTESNISSTLWYAKEIPLSGLVKLAMLEKGAKKETRTIIVLADYGTIAGTSLITEKPELLDFK